MIVEYFTKCLIYFIILGSARLMLKIIHPDIKGGDVKFSTICKWGLLSLIPFLRAITVCVLVILILIPKETLKKIREKSNENN